MADNRTAGEKWREIYLGASFLTWVVIFIGTWIYTIVAYGFLLGVGLGWLAAAITATVLCWLWPLYALVLLIGGGAIAYLALGGK